MAEKVTWILVINPGPLEAGLQILYTWY